MRDIRRLPIFSSIPASFVSIVALTLGTACSAPTFDEPKSGINAVQLGAEMSGYRFDPATIDSAYVVGDILHLHLSYGGCGTHAVALLQTGPFMESFPVQVPLSLAHDANGEACRMWCDRRNDSISRRSRSRIARRTERRYDSPAGPRSWRDTRSHGGTLRVSLRREGDTGRMWDAWRRLPV